MLELEQDDILEHVFNWKVISAYFVSEELEHNSSYNSLHTLMACLLSDDCPFFAPRFALSWNVGQSIFLTIIIGIFLFSLSLCYNATFANLVLSRNVRKILASPMSSRCFETASPNIFSNGDHWTCCLRNCGNSDLSISEGGKVQASPCHPSSSIA